MPYKNLAVLFVLLMCPWASANERSPLCHMYNGHKPDDPRYLDEYYQARGSPATSCVQQMAVRLSSGPDAADVVANAAVSACDSEAIKEAKSLPSPDVKQSFDEILAIVRTTMKRSALLAITTMRAGRCFSE